MRVLLVEDEPDLGAAVKQTLHQAGYVVDWVLNGNDAWDYLENHWTQYNLAIFDWLLPGMSGLELLQGLRSRNDSLPVMMLTAKDREIDKVIGLDSGADDYLVKPFGMAELLARLRALQRRSPQIQPSQLQVANLTLDYSTNTISSTVSGGEKKVISLTHKEFLLLEYFLRHPQQIVTREQILTQLWEVGEEPISNVVAAQIRLLRRKLEQHGCNNLIETVYGLGYRFNPPQSD
ncbi:two-component system response regulator RppA [Oscillatoria salina]|uniref:two-component system response regulator RppA n=1 Tax=Oscillatoria salina TaxID=331517 RepID=UPI0013B7A59C|nr:two-component system response regulator RppA [Oscillatoria salina]MBZ8183068.1 response regulator transcription factor [Oscillatoria salina IIICB1]NET90501.1 response regulator transcription factor [Kamptonema sp. SIO1D9]